MKPNKSLGQHWLYDSSSLEEVCDGVDVEEGDTILEVGPGLGTLSAKLLKRGAFVIAVEFDQALATSLSARLISEYSLKESDLSKLRIECEDILKYDLTKLPCGYKVVANIPYYLTSKLLRILNESANPPAKMSLLVQKEVAERVCAAAGSTSLLSISSQIYNDCSLGKVVPAHLFNPPPKVDSRVLIMKRHSSPLLAGINEKLFFQVVRAGFSERRKKLRSSLSGGLRLTKQEVDKLLLISGINSGSRAQELTINEWSKLADCYNKFYSPQAKGTLDL